MNPLKSLRHVAEAVFACFALVVVALLPRCGVVGFARWLGGLGFRFGRRDRRVALANLDLVFGETLSRTEKESIARQAFRTFALVILDLLWFQLCSRRRVSAWVTFDASCAPYFEPGPHIGVTAHFGNWEVMGQAIALRGCSMASVAAPLENPWVGRLLTRWRRSTGQQVVGKYGAVRVLLRTLRARGRVALLMDQNTLPAEGGLFVRFFGLPVPMSAAAAMLSRHTGADIVPMFCAPDGQGRYRAFALPPFRAGRGREADREATERLAGMLEQVIRQNPGGWLWMYKRWKFVPPGAPRPSYPFYARQVDEG